MTIPENIDQVRHRMRMAAVAAHRDVREIDLVCVSKFHDAAACLTALRHGERRFGESRVHEAAEKWPALREWFPSVELHLIGQLQSNKVDLAVATFDVIQSIDRPKIVDAVAAACRRQGRMPLIMVQVNIGREAQKGGCDPESTLGLVQHARGVGLRVCGLMCVPPMGGDVSEHFRTMRRTAAACDVVGLSMGMSADVETAIAHGATTVRVGAAIFGARPGKPPA